MSAHLATGPRDGGVFRLRIAGSTLAAPLAMTCDRCRTIFGLLRGVLILVGLVAGACATFVCMTFGYVSAYGHRCYGAPIHISNVRVRATQDAILQFTIERGACPSTVEQLVKERFLDKDKLRDTWGSRISLECLAVGERVTSVVRSAGPDRQFDTADDIVAN